MMPALEDCCYRCSCGRVVCRDNEITAAIKAGVCGDCLALLEVCS